MNIIFMGTPDFAAASLEELLKSRHQVKLVVTQPDKARGRKKELQPSEVKVVAQREGLPVFQPLKMKAPETLEELKKYQPDVIIVVAYGRIIPERILELPRYGCINVHASLLPKYRGAAPIQWAVLNGEEKSGVAVMQMDKGLDTGDILSMEETVLDPKETSDSLFEKLADMGAKLLIKTLDDIEKGQIQAVKQPAESPTPYARMICKEDGLIDWSKSAKEVERLVRGMNSWPAAYTFAEGKNVKIWDSQVIDEDSELEPGTISCADKNALRIQTGEGQLEILELQLQGKKRMPYDAFLRGCRWEAGMRLGSMN